MNPIIREWVLKVIGGQALIEGKVFGHDEYPTGTFFKTPPLVRIDFEAMTASTKIRTYQLEGAK